MDLFEEWIMKDNELIEYALTDKSYKSVYSKEHHENLPKNKTNFELATYGDAILKMCIMEILYDNKIEKPTEEKKKYESNKALVLIAEKYDLIKNIKTDGNRVNNYDYDYEKNKSKKGNKCKYIATCVEAIIAAIYINTGNLYKLKELICSWMNYIDKKAREL